MLYKNNSNLSVDDLEHLADDMRKEGIDKTALIIVGDVLDHEYELSKLYDKDFVTGFRGEKTPFGEEIVKS